MKALGWSAVYAVLYAVCGGAFLWQWAVGGSGLYALPGACFLALSAWEVRRAFRVRRTGGGNVWSPTLDIAYVILALCNIGRGIAEPTGFNVGVAVCWSILGVLYAAKALRELRGEDTKKEEAS